MLKSAYIKRENERLLLVAGYVCVSEDQGIQTWVDMQKSGEDIFHLVHNYPIFVDELDCLSSKDAEEKGAIYFVVKYAKKSGTYEGASLPGAISVSRANYSSLPM